MTKVKIILPKNKAPRFPCMPTKTLPKLSIKSGTGAVILLLLLTFLWNTNVSGVGMLDDTTFGKLKRHDGAAAKKKRKNILI